VYQQTFHHHRVSHQATFQTYDLYLSIRLMTTVASLYVRSYFEARVGVGTFYRLQLRLHPKFPLILTPRLRFWLHSPGIILGMTLSSSKILLCLSQLPCIWRHGYLIVCISTFILRFSTTAEYLLNVEWEVNMYSFHSVHAAQEEFFLDCLNVKAPQSFEMVGHHTPEDLNSLFFEMFS
jgi:hypothetical protein